MGEGSRACMEPVVVEGPSNSQPFSGPAVGVVQVGGCE